MPFSIQQVIVPEQNTRGGESIVVRTTCGRRAFIYGVGSGMYILDPRRWPRAVTAAVDAMIATQSFRGFVSERRDYVAFVNHTPALVIGREIKLIVRHKTQAIERRIGLKGTIIGLVDDQ